MDGDGEGFVPDSIPEGVDVVVLAQNPGGDEERGQRVIGYDGKKPVYEPCAPQPLVGKTGYDVRTRFLPMLGEGVTVGFANVLKCRLQGPDGRTNNLPTGKVLDSAVSHCTSRYLRLGNPKLIIAMGALAWEYTQGKGLPISDWRGFVGPKGV